jgi:hypothetical protein
MKAKQWIFLAVWFLCYTLSLEFFRFKFGLFEIGAVYVIIGIPLVWFFGRQKKPRSN